MPIKKLIMPLAVILLFISGCESSSNNSSEKKSSPEDGLPFDDPKATFACYLKKCFTTKSISTVTPQFKDYLYPNPNTFPQADRRGQYLKPTRLIDLRAFPPSTPMSENFTLEEFMAEHKGPYALFSSSVATAIQLIRNELNAPLFITSGYRSPGYNSRVDGSAKWSRHTYGDALDFYSDAANLNQLKALCEKHKASFTLLYATHIHCDWRLQKLDPAFYTAVTNKNSVTPDEINTFAAQKLALLQDISRQGGISLTQNQQGYLVDYYLEEIDDDVHEGQPLIEWEIIYTDDTNKISDSAQLQLPTLENIRKISVQIGQSIVIERTF